MPKFFLQIPKRYLELIIWWSFGARFYKDLPRGGKEEATSVENDVRKKPLSSTDCWRPSGDQRVYRVLQKGEKERGNDTEANLWSSP